MTAWLQKWVPDIGVVMACGHKLSKRFLAQFSTCVVNVHRSKLPESRVGAPMMALITEQRPLVISANIVSPRFDDGPILGRTESFDIDSMELDPAYRLVAGLVCPFLRQVVVNLVQGEARDEASASCRWYKDLQQKLAIFPIDTLPTCRRKLLASNPKHGISLRLPSAEGSRVLRASAGCGLQKAHNLAPGTVVDVTEDSLTVAVSDGMLHLHQGGLRPKETQKDCVTLLAWEKA